MCGPALAEVVAARRRISLVRTGMLSIRPPLKPVPLAEIAGMDLDSDTPDSANWLLDGKASG